MKVADLFATLRLKPDKKSFKAADHLMTRVKQALVAIVAFKTAQFFGGMFQHTIEAGDRLDELAQKTGVGTTALQELGYAAQFSGISQEQLGQSIGKMSKQILAARDGSDEAQRSFRRVGVSMEQLRRGNPDEILATIADTFQTMPDGARKTALAMQVFGRSGADLIPFLNAGSAGIERLRKEARDLGVVIGESTVKEMAEFADTQDRVKSVLVGLKNEGVKAILPYIREVTEQFFEWVKANRDIIQTRIKQFVKALIVGFKALIKAGIILGKMFAVLADHFEDVVIVVGSLVAAFVILQAGAIAAAIASAAAWAAALAPFIALAAAIAGIIYVIKNARTIWDVIVRAWRAAVDVFVGWIEGVINWINDKIDAIIERARRIKNFFTGGGPAANASEAIQRGLPAAQRLLQNHNANQTVNTTVNVNVPPGTDPNQVGQVVREEFDRNWDRNVRQSAAVTGIY